MSSNKSFGPLLVVVFESILEVFILCAAGYILAWKGILEKKTQKQLNRINVSIFTPSLLFSKVAFFLSPEKLKELWIVPFFFLITTAVSMGVAYVLGTMFRLKRSQRSFAMAAAMFMNSNSLPIALMQSLVVTVPDLKWKKDDTKSAMIGRALTYLVLHSTLGMVLRWSYGVRLLAAADPETIPTAEGLDNEVLPDTPTIERSETGFPPAPYEPHQQRATSQWPEPDPIDVGDVPPRPAYTGPPILVHTTSNRLLRPFASRRSTGVFHSFPNSPAPTPGPLPSIPATPSTNSSQTRAGTPDSSDEFAGTRVREVRGPSTWRKFKRQVRHGWATFNDFMTMPLWAAVASLVVALIQPVQHALDVHFPPVKNALNAAGQCSIPITLIVLGAYFYTPPEDQKGQIRLDGPERDLHMPAADEEGDAAATRASKRLSQVSVVGSVRSMLGLDQLKDGRADYNALLAPSNESARPGETKTVWVAVLSRMVITPLLLLPGMALSAYFDWHQVLEDPVFVVSNVLLIASPPALTLAQITQAASGDAFERLISRTIFWSYCVVTPPSTILFVVVGLMLAKL